MINRSKGACDPENWHHLRFDEVLNLARHDQSPTNKQDKHNKTDKGLCPLLKLDKTMYKSIVDYYIGNK